MGSFPDITTPPATGEYWIETSSGSRNITQSSLDLYLAGLFADINHTHAGVYEPVLGNPGQDGYCLKSTANGARSWGDCVTAGDNLGSATYSDVVALWPACTGYLKDDGTCDIPPGGAVASVNSQTGAVVLAADDIAETATRIWPTPTQETNWDTAFGWGDHGLAGYLTPADLAPLVYDVGGLNAVAGTVASGAYTDMAEADGTSVEINETAVAPAVDVRLTFNGVSNLNNVLIYGNYDGGTGHEVAVEIYNPTSTAWEGIGTILVSTTAKWHSLPVINGLSYINGSSQALVRLYHADTGNPSHDLSLDLFQLRYSASAQGGVTDHGALTGLDGDDHPQYMRKDNIGTGPDNYVQLDNSGRLPAVDGSQLLNLPVGGAVASVFTRTGAVTAQSGDYTADQITETATRVFPTPEQETNWDISYGWGDHGVQNYLDLDTYPNADTDATDDFDGAFDSLTGVPTTLSGYGITDAPTKTGDGATGNWGINITGTAGIATSAVRATASDTVALVDDNTSGMKYLPFASPATGDVALKTNNKLYLNAFLGEIYATNFIGDLVGNADTVTNGVYTTDAGSLFEPATSNDFDPDRLAGDTTDDNLIDEAIIDAAIARDSELPTTPGEVGAEPADSTIIKESELSSAVDSTSTTTAANSAAVKAVYDLANGKQDPLVAGTDYTTPTGSAATMTVVASGFSGNLPTSADTLQEIADAVDGFSLGGTAADVSIADAGGLYDATDAEAAFAEVMMAVNLVDNDTIVTDAKLDFGAKGDGIIHAGFSISANDCSITSSDQTLTCTTGIFNDPSRTIIVSGAGAAGADLETTIDSVTSAYEIELTDAASTTVSDALVRYGEGGCSMSASGTTLTCTNAVFTDTATDSGKAIAVEGAGVAGVTLVTTINTVTSTTVAELTDSASTAVDYVWMKYGSNDTTAIQNATSWASDNEGKVHFPGGLYMYDDESVLADSGLIEGDGSYVTLFTPLPGYSGGWFLTLNDTWGNATPNPLGGKDGGMGVNSEGISPDDHHQGPVLLSFSVIGQRMLDPVGSNGIRTYNRVDRTIWSDVSFFYLNGTCMSLGLEGGTDYGGPGQMGCLRESQFFRNIVRGCGVSGSHRAFELGTQPSDAGGANWKDATNINSFYTLQLIYDYGESGVYDFADKSLKTRETTFYDLKLHGFANYESWQTDAIDRDLFVLQGAVRDTVFTDLRSNGGHVGGAQIRIKEDPATNEYPFNIKIDHNSRQFFGDDVAIEQAGNVKIAGYVDGESGGNAVYIAENAIKSGKVIIDQQELNSPPYNISPTELDSVSFRHFENEEVIPYSNDEFVETDPFETDTTGWTLTYGAGTPDSRNGRTTDESYFGDYSLGLFGGTGPLADGNLVHTYTLPDGDYTLSFNTKTSVASGISVTMYLESSVDGLLNNASITADGWQNQSFSITSSGGSVTVTWINSNYDSNQEGFWIDNVQITRDNPPADGESLIYDSSLGKWTHGVAAGTIAEGDSSIEVTDSGTGEIDVVLDGDDTVMFGSDAYYSNSAVDIVDNVSSEFNMISANDSPTGTNYFRFLKSRGTLSSPTATQDGDILGLFYFGGYNGTDWDVRGFMQGTAVNAWTPTSEAFKVELKSKAVGESAGSTTRLTVEDDGTITISDLAGSYTGGSAYVCVDDNGTLFASESACP